MRTSIKREDGRAPRKWGGSRKVVGKRDRAHGAPRVSFFHEWGGNGGGFRKNLSAQITNRLSERTQTAQDENMSRAARNSKKSFENRAEKHKKTEEKTQKMETEPVFFSFSFN